MTHSMRWVSAFPVFLVAACGSLEPIRLEKAPSAPFSFEFVDGRSGASIGGRNADVAGEKSQFLGDERFSPSRIEYLRAALERCCEAVLAGRRVVVTDFDVSFRRVVSSSYTDSAGAALVRELRSLATERTACSRIRVEIGVDAYSGSQCDNASTTDGSDGVRAALRGSLGKLAADIRSQPPRDPPPIARSNLEASARVAVEGFSVQPPGGDGWVRIPAGRGATFARRLAHDHTAAAQILPVPAQEQPSAATFEAAIRIRARSKLLPGRNRIEREDYRATTIAGLECVTYHLEITDTGVRPDGTPFLLQVRGQVCRRALGDGPWVDVLFSERGGPRDFTPEVLKQGDEFLASLLG